MEAGFVRETRTHSGGGDARYRISRAGIADLWGLVADEQRLGVEERVFLALALSELERGRTRARSCR